MTMADGNNTWRQLAAPDNTSAVKDLLEQHYRDGSVPLIFIIPILSAIGFLGNLMMFKYYRCQLLRCMVRSRFPVVMCILATVDGLICSVILPMYLVTDHLYFSDTSVGLGLCKCLRLLSSGLCLTSHLILLALSLDCYLSTSVSQVAQFCKRHLLKLHSVTVALSFLAAAASMMDAGFVQIQQDVYHNLDIQTAITFSGKCYPGTNRLFNETRLSRYMNIVLFLVYLTGSLATFCLFKATLRCIRKICTYSVATRYNAGRGHSASVSIIQTSPSLSTSQTRSPSVEQASHPTAEVRQFTDRRPVSNPLTADQQQQEGSFTNIENMAYHFMATSTVVENLATAANANCRRCSAICDNEAPSVMATNSGSNLQATKSLTLMLLLTSIHLLLYVVYIILDIIDWQLTTLGSPIIHQTYLINSIINPLVYIIMLKGFRKFSFQHFH